MNCGKCGRPLVWKEGAFCSSCMAEGNELAQLRADLAAVKDQCNRQEHGFARRENDLQRDLTAALSGGADAAAQRDTALGLCKERERELADARAYTQSVQSERARVEQALVETLAALESRQTILDDVNHSREALFADLESTRADLARSEARVKELEAELRHDGF